MLDWEYALNMFYTKNISTSMKNYVKNSIWKSKKGAKWRLRISVHFSAYMQIFISYLIAQLK